MGEFTAFSKVHFQYEQLFFRIKRYILNVPGLLKTKCHAKQFSGIQNFLLSSVLNNTYIFAATHPYLQLKILAAKTLGPPVGWLTVLDVKDLQARLHAAV